MIITYAREEPMPAIPDLSIEAPVESLSVNQTFNDGFRLIDGFQEVSVASEKGKTPILNNSIPFEKHSGESLVAWGLGSPFYNDPLRWIERNKPIGSDMDETETASFGVSPTLQSVLNICASRPHSFSDI